jgi:hypothetical protein
MADGSAAPAGEVSPRVFSSVAARARGMSIEFRQRHPLATARAPWLLVAALVAYATGSLWNATAFSVPVPLVLALILGVGPVGLFAGRRLGLGRAAAVGPIEALIVTVLIAMALNDLWLLQSVGLRDLGIYLRAGWMFNVGGSVYLDSPMAVLPGDQTLLPFLYPPFTLPFFGWLARLPYALVAAAWVLASVLAVVASLRLFGLSWRWSTLFLLWPPVAEGVWVGNVAVPAMLLFAVGPWAAAALPFTATFKLQSAIPVLWLVGEQRWRALGTAVGVALALVVLTLPVVGPDRWREWIDGLVFFAQSAPGQPGLYGLGLPALVGPVGFVALGVAAVAFALRRRGRAGLARLGLASIVASPSLYSHGFLLGLPAFLTLRASWFWVAMGLTCSVAGIGWWGAVGLTIGGWFVPALVRSDTRDAARHPLGTATGPWPAAPPMPRLAPQPAGAPVGANVGVRG